MTPLLGLVSLLAACGSAPKDPGDTSTDQECETSLWYSDPDGDGWGAGTPVEACTAPAGFVDRDGDCDETDPAVNPGAEELCDGFDNDCDGETDEDGEPVSWHRDQDGDGYGDPVNVLVQCEQPAGYVLDGTDCLDTDARVHPGADEYCDDVDWDCDGELLDEDAVDAATWHLDLDGDGYGDPLSAATACLQPEGMVADSSDCDDLDPAVNPAADEVCDGIDNNCDGLIDDDDPAVLSSSMSTWYIDEDGDGYGVPTETALACAAPEGFAASDEDCDDTDPSVYPGSRTWSVPGELDSIQQAIDAACTLDTILVEAGSYPETLDFGDKALSLVGAGADLTSIDGGASGSPVIRLRAGSVEGFTITNGSAPRGAGLFASEGDWLVLSELVLSGNVASESGGGLLIEQISVVELFDLEIRDNSVVSEGGGAWISVPEGGSLEGSGLQIRDNTSGRSGTVRGGGLFLEATGPARLSELSVSGNRLPTTSSGYGGGIYVDGDADLSGANVADNSAYGYHAYGGGVYADGTVNLSGATLSGNFASGSYLGYGGGVYAPGTVDLSGALVQDNSTHGITSSRAAGVHASGTVDLSGATIVENLVYSNYGASVSAAGVYASGTVNLAGATISRNTASSDASAYGVGVHTNGTVDLSGATVSDNDSSACSNTEGGGVYAAGTVDLTGARITGNIGASSYSTSDVRGGGLIVDGDVTISGTTISGNTTTTEGTVYGGIYVDHPEVSLLIEDSVIAGNSGMGIYIWVEETAPVIELRNLTIVGNGGDGVGMNPAWLRQIILSNVLVAHNLGYGISLSSGSYDQVVGYTNVWGNGSGGWSGLDDLSGTDGNLAVDPQFSAFHIDADWTLWDLHLAPGSPLFDVGDPSLLDADGSVSEIGAWSGSDWYLDADSDGMYDGWETWHGLDPSLDDAAEDPDGDGLSNLEELLLGTWPNVADTDGDGVDDGDEVAAGTNPLVVD